MKGFFMLRIIVFSLFFIGCSISEASLSSQKFESKKKQDTQSEITIEDFKSHIGYLASDKLEGRSSGTKGDKLAKDYIANHFRTASLPTERFVEVQEHYVPAKRIRRDNIKDDDKTVLTYNIIATLPGNDPVLKDEFVVIGGHYDSTKNPQKLRKLFNTTDSINNGADDNASGTSMVLELFEKFASTNDHKRTLVFILFGGEELGLLGAQHYVKNPTIDLDKVQLMVNLDMVGRLDDKKSLYLGGIPSAENFDKKLEPLFNKTDFNLVGFSRSTSQRSNLFSASDHYMFYLSDVPVLFFFTGLHEDYHKPSDEYHKVNYEGMKQISDLVEPVVLNFANSADKLVFTEIKQEEDGQNMQRNFKVSLRVMPDYSSPEKGFSVGGVIKDGPGDKAGIKKGDIVVMIGDKEIDDIYKYMDILSILEPEMTTTVTVLRNGNKKVLNVTF